MACAPLAVSVMLPPPGGPTSLLAPAVEGALERLLGELHADHPPQPGPGHRSHRARFTEVLAALGRLAATGDQLEPLLATACRLVAETLVVDATALLGPAEGPDRLVVRAGAGALAGAVDELVACGPGTQAGDALGQPGSTSSADATADWTGDRFLARHGFTASALAVVPGLAGPLGLLGAFEPGLRAFEPDELMFLEAAAACLSAALVRHGGELERQRLQDRLALADRLVSIGSLAGGVAHELNNPLSYVTANLSFISEEVAALAQRLEAAGASSPELAETACQLIDAAADARDGVEKLRGLVRDLHTLSHGDDSAVTPLDLTHVLESALRVAVSATTSRVRVERELATSLPPVLANGLRLGQVFLNLFISAARAAAEGPGADHLIRVRSFAGPGPRVVVEVSDTGRGIPATQLARAFDPFLEASGPGAGAGTGLGLSVCKSIVDGLGGVIEVESVVGAGSTFRILLPAAPMEQLEAPEEHPPRAARRASVLVVDDEPMVGVVVQRTLGAECDVVSVTSATEALARLQAGASFDVIFSDLLMPGMSGVELHGEVSRRFPAQAASMVFLSGGAFTPASSAFLARPGVECIEKPFELDALRAAIARRLDRRPDRR